jgi:thiazole synthase
VLGDPQTLFPNMPETLKAAATLVKDGFQVMVYCADDPIQARMLEDLGCVAIMPLASLIGSGMGILNPWNLKLIIDQAKCRCWSMPASAPPRTPRSPWNWAATGC